VHRGWFEAQLPSYSEPVRIRLLAGRRSPAGAYLTAQRVRRLLITEAAERMKELNVLLAPAAPVTGAQRSEQLLLGVAAAGEERCSWRQRPPDCCLAD